MSKVGRNDPCPCGSGKKYKKCCSKKPLGPRKVTVQQAGASANERMSKTASLLTGGLTIPNQPEPSKAKSLSDRVSSKGAGEKSIATDDVFKKVEDQNSENC